MTRGICSGEKGTSLIKFIVKKHKPYLYGNRFVVDTDAKSVLGILNKVDLPTDVAARWVAYLQMLDFDIVHIFSKENAVADALSWFSNEDMEVETLSIIKNTPKKTNLPEGRNEELLHVLRLELEGNTNSLDRQTLREVRNKMD
ncbi:hypothetical protein AYI68_g3782 [Smittium mucronatum]|uniref:Uncharacterized protein n=1 Tax=Smittium mucronatum TaxID=133383 RepID=A0A1R0GYX4_9FUNG|nr:hypothetical protein AYI68_g3782 [Smittium mucronatum]